MNKASDDARSRTRSTEVMKPAYSKTPAAQVVTVDNFRRAESDMHFATIVKLGGLGRFVHHRDLISIDEQEIVRLNRDTLYSAAVCDLDASPATVTLPDAGRRFRSMMAIDEDHYVFSVAYSAGRYTFTREKVGTRFLLIALRTLVDPNDSDDLRQVHALQNTADLYQTSIGRFEVPAWELPSQKKVRDALLVLGETIPDSRLMFGARSQVDPVRHLIGTAMGWGGSPEKEAMYMNFTPGRNDGATAYRLTLRSVPVDGFWSISVYNSHGFFEPNERNAYSVNSITAKKANDGWITVQFGGCEASMPTFNCLPIMSGWNYTVRLYRPRAEILSGMWSFPEAQPVA